MNLQSYHLLTQPKSVLQVENYLYHIVFHETAGYVNPLIAREAREKFFWSFSAKKVPPPASEVWGGGNIPQWEVPHIKPCIRTTIDVTDDGCVEVCSAAFSAATRTAHH